jgi:WD40 repeat protein
MKTVTYTICFLCLAGCAIKSNKDDSFLVDKFPLVETLIGTEIKVPPILLKPSNMCIVDSFLIVSQSRKDSLFTLFKLPDCEHILSFGMSGRGPNEFNLSMEYVTLGAVSGNSSMFAVGNMLTNIQYYRINDIIKRDIIPYKVAGLPSELSRFRAITYLGDSVIFGAPYGGNIHICKYNTVTMKLESFRDYPEVFPFDDPEIIREPFGYTMAAKPDNTKIVLGYYFKGTIEIYDLQNGKSLTLSYKGFPSLKENTGLNSTSKFMKHNPEELIFCRNIAATNKYIYVDVLNDHYSKIFNENGPKRSFISEIHVFDWSGNPIAKFRFVNFYRFFDIDKMDKYLYAIDDSIENVIKRYDLSEILPE